ncbi:MAG UNVERIFIED_CONTAM: recombinase family protein [Thermobifida fusca]
MTDATSPHRPRHDRSVATPIRVSTYVHGRRDDAVMRQQDVLRAWIADHPGWQLSGQYVDVRPNRQRPRFGLRQALAAARDGRYDVLLVHDLSRLTRRMPELADILHTLDRARVALRSADGALDTSTPVGRLFAHMVVAFADFDIAAPRLPSTTRGGQRRTSRAPRSRDRDRSTGRGAAATP